MCVKYTVEDLFSIDFSKQDWSVNLKSLFLVWLTRAIFSRTFAIIRIFCGVLPLRNKHVSSGKLKFSMENPTTCKFIRKYRYLYALIKTVWRCVEHVPDGLFREICVNQFLIESAVMWTHKLANPFLWWIDGLNGLCILFEHVCLKSSQLIRHIDIYRLYISGVTARTQQIASF